MKNNRKFYPGIRPAAAMLLCSCIAFSVAASYVPAGNQDAVTVAAPVTEPQSEASKETSKTMAVTSAALPVKTTEKAYEPAPYLLNLVYQFPEGSEESWAEVFMKELIQKDSRWYAEIYDLANTAPQKLASRLGKPASSVLGTYNPTSKTQKEDDPTTWAVEHFKNVRVSFYNGDGEVTSAVSNAQDILSMGSVYAYYNEMVDMDQLRSYLDQLWRASHSYSASMGDVYYCDGCVNPDEVSEEEEDSELENEDSFQSGRIIDTEINGAPEETSDSGETGESGETEESGESEESQSSDLNQSGQIPESVVPAPTEEKSVPTSGETVPEGAVSEENTEVETPSVPEETVIEVQIGRTVTIITEPETSEKETTEFVWDPETAAPPLIIRLDDEKEKEKTESVSETPPSVEEGEDGDEDVGESSHEDPALVATSSEASEATSTKSSSKKNSGKTNGSSGPDNKICPGHVDLKITAKIYTLSEKSNLYQLDQTGNTVTEGSSWKGWTSRTKAFVRHIDRQNWIDQYGLNITLPGTRAPLSSAEIESYMSQLSSDTTEERKNIIRFALQSVGKVPYYWGGKPSSQNYSGNNFGSVTIPDHRGRILRGLDCSGWVNWVYWSVTGNRLPYEGTEGLKILGSQVKRQDLKPGDLVVITGSTPHVIMFMNWTADGQIQCIHETGSANNVTVGVMTANWPYYRNILD